MLQIKDGFINVTVIWKDLHEYVKSANLTTTPPSLLIGELEW